MLIAIDIGNTRTHFGVFKDAELVHQRSIPTDKEKIALFEDAVSKLTNECGGKIDGAIISSVVPELTGQIQKWVRENCMVNPLLVSPGLKSPISIAYASPDELGADRIANAAAAYQLYKRAVIIVDFGTAITLCAVSKDGEYIGGIIAPGVELSRRALIRKASLLPEMTLEPPKQVLGRDTISCMRSGIVYGFTDLVDGLVLRLKDAFDKDAFVVATGGDASLIGPLSKTIDKIEPFLTLKGLQILYELNQR